MLTLFLIKLAYLKSIEEDNASTYQLLNKISKQDEYSKIKMNFYDKCPYETKNCSNVACEVPQMNFKGKGGVIDLLTTIESYSPSITNGGEVWKNIYEVNDDPKLITLLDGLRFSVFTHITAFYKKMFFTYFSNPSLFQKKFKQKYKDSFIQLYYLVRSAVGYLKYLNVELTPDLNELVNSITVDKYSITKPDRNYLDLIDSIISDIACLDCQKCILWGTLQSRGLKAAIEVLNDNKISQKEMIYLINFFRRLSETVVQSKKMSSIIFPQLYSIIIHTNILLTAFAIILFVLYRFVRAKYTKALIIKSNMMTKKNK